MEQQLEKLEGVHGKLKEIITPSGDKILIREQNGNDDDILSNPAAARDGDSFNLFIKGIVIFSQRVQGPFSMENILSLPLRDKYFILLASRIYSLGEIIQFKWNWGSEDKPDEQSYEEDLAQYIWDYSKAFPEEGEPEYFSERIAPYGTKDTFMEFEVGNSKRKVQVDYLNGHGEKYLLGLLPDEMTVNTALKARKIRVESNGGWQEVSNFKIFKASEMKDIRSAVLKYDTDTNVISELNHPTTGAKQDVSLIQVPDFFFPLSI